MRTREEIRQLVQHERQLKTRLRLATTRLADAECERIWAIVAAYEAGLSIRKIAAATGLSRSRIHQLLQDDDAHEIPAWLTYLRDRAISAEAQTDTNRPSAGAEMKARIAADFDALARNTSGGETVRPEEDGDPRTRHRRRLAVPEGSPRGRTAKEQRDAIRKAAGLPPYHGDDADDVRGTS